MNLYAGRRRANAARDKQAERDAQAEPTPERTPAG
jgi:hypothetical protein